MTLVRRFLVVAAVTLWLGGVTFYAGFVIRIAHRVLGGAQAFGFVTAEVTALLNFLGVGAVALLLANLLADRRVIGGKALGWALAGTWVVLVATLAGLFLLHAKLDDILVPSTRTVTDRRWFKPVHELYQLVLGIQWVAAVTHLALVLAAWRRADLATPDRTEPLPPAP